MGKFIKDVVNIGEYVEYHPTKLRVVIEPEFSGADRPQHFFPAAHTLWRVFRSETGKVQLISASPVGKLTLEDDVGYRNSVDILQHISFAHVDSSMVASARCLGYTKGNVRTLLTPMTRKYVKKHWEDKAYNDKEYNDDINWLKERKLLPFRGKTIWLASRGLYGMGEEWIYFAVNILRDDGKTMVKPLAGIHACVKHMRSSATNEVYVILTLKSDVKLKSGTGSEKDPYVI